MGELARQALACPAGCMALTEALRRQYTDMTVILSRARAISMMRFFNLALATLVVAVLMGQIDHDHETSGA
jgi:hypothetical protein